MTTLQTCLRRMFAATLLLSSALMAAPSAEQAMALAEQEAARADARSSGAVSCPGKQLPRVRYHVRRLEIPGGVDAYAGALNNLGKVVGTSLVDGSLRPTLWIGSKAFLLPTLGLPYGQANAINDFGVIVGATALADGNTHATSWIAGKAFDLGTLGPNQVYSAARGINLFGQVVGTGAVPNSQYPQALAWTAGRARALPALGMWESNATSINDFGYSVGSTSTSGGPRAFHAAMWRPDGTVVDLGTSGGISSTAADINNRGKIVGQDRLPSGQTVPVFWDQGRVTHLPALSEYGGGATSINNRDEIVGWAVADDTSEVAMLWIGLKGYRLASLLDGESQGTQISYASAINDRGQIVATLGRGREPSQPLLLTPRRCRD